MADKYLNTDRLSELWSKIKTLVGTKVSKTGDTMTGTLNVIDGGKIHTTGDCDCDTLNAQSLEVSTSSSAASTVLRMTKADVDSSKSNNNLSSGTEYAALYAKDGSDRNMGKFGTNISSGGDISSEMYARNFNTSGSNVCNNSLQLIAKKNGNAEVNISHPAAWRSAIGLGYTPSGTTFSNTSVSTATSTHKTMGTLSIPANSTCMIIYQVTFPSNATGYRHIYISETESSTMINMLARKRSATISGSDVDVELITFYSNSTSSAKTLYCRAWHNAGATLSLSPRYWLWRIL